ncbi:MAG: lasso peptide biosynthesis B2 protein [Caldilineaceae bacterium]|nr:lasso peptide biosynthesis B2 protein [Caldilineaceae bacterium]
MMRRFRVWRGLPRDQKQIVLTAWLLFPLLIIGLKLWGYGRLQARLQRWVPAHAAARAETAPSSHATVITAREIGRAVNIAARYSLLPARCLSRSMMLWWLLHRRGVAAELRIGVRKGAQGFEAHAWVEQQGFVLNDSQDVKNRFAVFDTDMAAAAVFRS